MNQTTAHVVTLWCALLSKSLRLFKGVAPKSLPLIVLRVALQLAICERIDADPATPTALGRMLVVKPMDALSALMRLDEAGLAFNAANPFTANAPRGFADASHARIDPLASRTRRALPAAKDNWRLTENGRVLACSAHETFTGLIDPIRRRLTPADARSLACLAFDIVAKPGSYLAAHPALPERGEPLDCQHYLTAVSALHAGTSSGTKRAAGLSLTDFHFLLELYPKKRHVTKHLRPRDIARYLRVSKSYVTAASYRLGDAGLIDRAYDPTDARGMLLTITPLGHHVADDVGLDIFAAYEGLSHKALFDLDTGTRVLSSALRAVDSQWRA